MSWVKLDDRFFTNPKVMRAGRDARDLYLAGLCYCAAELTDGFIPESVIPLLYVMAGVTPLPEHNATITRLLHVALWEEAEDGFRVHDYTDYNPSAAQVKRERAANAKRVQEWRGRHPEEREKRKGRRNAVTPPISNGVRNAGVTPPPSPYPSPTIDPSPTEMSLAPATPDAMQTHRNGTFSKGERDAMWDAVVAECGDAVMPQAKSRRGKVVGQLLGAHYSPEQVKTAADTYRRRYEVDLTDTALASHIDRLLTTDDPQPRAPPAAAAKSSASSRIDAVFERAFSGQGQPGHPLNSDGRRPEMGVQEARGRLPRQLPG